MKLSFITQAAAGLLVTTGAFAHEGHGLPGAHWHATDVWGFVAFAALLAVAIWLSGRGK